MQTPKNWKYEAFSFDDWFHKEWTPADEQTKQMADRGERLSISASQYLEELRLAFEAGRNSVLQSDDFDVLIVGDEISAETHDKLLALRNVVDITENRKADLLFCIRRLMYALEGVESCWPELLDKKEEKK